VEKRKYFDSAGNRTPAFQRTAYSLYWKSYPNSTIIMRHDAWTPEACGQKSTTETFVARQRLAETRFRGKRMRLYKSTRCLKTLTRFVAMENNKEQSTVQLGVLYSVRMKFVHAKIQPDKNSRDQTTTKQADVEDFILCVIIIVIFRVV
jgi:hypothetical protein